MTCDVTVLIPVFNRSRVLRRALGSVACQSMKPREVIIIDDGSDQEELVRTRAAVADFRGLLNVKLLEHGLRGGANAARNSGIREAKSKYIAFLDSDDVWLPSKLARQYQSLIDAKSNDDTVGLSFTGRYRVDENGKITAVQFGRTPVTPRTIRAGNIIGPLSSVMVSTRAARDIRGFQEDLVSCQDWDFYIRLVSRLKHVSVSDPLFAFVEHGGERITSNPRSKLRGLFHIRRTFHPVSSGESQNRGSIYKDIAEQFENMGRYHRAQLFLERSIILSRGHKLDFRSMFEVIVSRVRFKLLGETNIKEGKNRTYRKTLVLKNEKFESDQQFILSLF